MNSFALAALVFIGYMVAYYTYGRFLARRIFRIEPERACPSRVQRDDIDFVPTDRRVLFGHHFTSIAGLGPIVGPAIAIVWGWVPAVLWVFFGSIFMGAVHDFGTLVVSLRGQGRSIGDLAADIVNPRVRTLFLVIIFFSLWIVIAIFALIIALLFTMYPQSILPVWIQIPIAMGLGYLVYRKGMNPGWLGLLAVVLMYASVVAGAYLPFEMPKIGGFEPLVIWIVVLLIYAYVASTLPVQMLLQPRDYINGHQLIVAMGLLALGAALAHPPMVAPAYNPAPAGAPALWPFLFVVIACGAISGFHCLVSSGTSSKQCDNERNAQFIGYGSMLLEGALATLVIVSVGAGIGLGLTVEGGEVLTGSAAFSHHYASWAAANGLSANLGAFVAGAGNLIETLGIPHKITVAIMGVFLVSFAATTLDSATRIQRYIVAELAKAWGARPLARRHPATSIAVATAFLLAFSNGSGKGAMALWPLFGTVNQLLAALALLVVTVYLARRRTSVVVTAIPMVFMVGMTGWAMILNLIEFYSKAGWADADAQANLMRFAIALIVLGLEVWMIVESAIVLKTIYARNRSANASDTLLESIEGAG